jgi:PAS domain S-box-containing protein
VIDRGEHRPAARADLAVARILAATAAEDSLYPRLLAAIGNSIGWDFGAWWEADEHGSLRCVEAWQSIWLHAGEFETLTRQTLLAPGSGLPGRVLDSGQPAWIANLGDDPNFPRSEGAARAGLRSGFAFPVTSARGPLGAIEMFATREHAPDDELLHVMASLGSQLGQLIERREAGRQIEASNERRKAILDAALDCVITIDHRGRVVEFNPAAERTFGMRAEEAVGREMAGLIIPPSLRERHRAGMARLLATGEPRIVDQRLELSAVRANGTEFPVELTVTRIDLPGPPMFTGYVRDITDRKRAEAELRASRARIVEAADAARLRLERDLHDGAQARLVNLALALRLARAKLEDPDQSGPLLDEAIEELAQTTNELREFARGIHPAVLTEGGLTPSFRALAARSRVPVRFGHVTSTRLPPRVEAALYFVATEALTNAARYAEATCLDINVGLEAGHVTLEVRDDGLGGASMEKGSGLLGLADRIAALDGTFDVISDPGLGTTVRARVPCA